MQIQIEGKYLKLWLITKYFSKSECKHTESDLNNSHKMEKLHFKLIGG